MLDDGNYSTNDFEMMSHDQQSTFLQKIPSTISNKLSEHLQSVEQKQNNYDSHQGQSMNEIHNFVTNLKEEFQNNNPCSTVTRTIGENHHPKNNENDHVTPYASAVLATSPNNLPLVKLVQEFVQIMTHYQYETPSEIDLWKLYDENNYNSDQNKSIERKFQPQVRSNDNTSEVVENYKKIDNIKETLEKTIMFQTTFPYDNGIDIQQMRNDSNLHNNNRISVILCICNPLQSILQSFLLSSQRKQWTEWRDIYFVEMLESWTSHIEYWMDLQIHENPLVISHERLIGTNSGIATALQLHQYITSTVMDINNHQSEPLPQPQPQSQLSFENNDMLDSSSTISSTNSIDVGCIWAHIFQNKAILSYNLQPFHYDDNVGIIQSLLRQYPYTESQMKLTLNAIIQLKSQYSFISDLTIILNNYIQLIDAAMYRELSNKK